MIELFGVGVSSRDRGWRRRRICATPKAADVVRLAEGTVVRTFADRVLALGDGFDRRA